MKITLDTNVLISALIINGKSRTLLSEIMHRRDELILSKEILEEFTEVSRDPKIRRYVKEGDANVYLRSIANLTRIIQIRSKFSIVKEDADDDIILRTAHDGKAKYLVTGDKHLTKLKKFRGTGIVTVDEMLRILRRH